VKALKFRPCSSIGYLPAGRQGVPDRVKVLKFRPRSSIGYLPAGRQGVPDRVKVLKLGHVAQLDTCRQAGST